mgnify:CR=1 FL=1
MLTLFLSACIPTDTEVSYLYPGDTKMWNNIFNNAKKYNVPNETQGAVLPHHMVAAFEIAGFYKSLAAQNDYSTIFLVGPNHYESGKENIQTCTNCIFNTTSEPVELNQEFISKILADKQATERNESFVQEHAIFTHAPFIKNAWPKAKIVPVLLQWEMPQDELDSFAEWLNENLPANSLVLASVDFSHYIPWEAADFHDLASHATIQNFDFENIYDLEVDSPSSLYLLLKLMQARNSMHAARHDHTNLAQYLTVEEYITTSHQYFSFSPGKINPQKSITVQYFGAIPDEENLQIIDDWNWGESYSEYLRDIQGIEDRFLTGTDFLVFNPEPGCETKTQNNMSIAFCSFNDEITALQEISKIIGAQDFISLHFTFTGNSNPQKTAHKFIDSGVDILIGHGLQEIPENETYNEALIYYSLGDFISPGQDSNGEVIGIHFSPDSMTEFSFPITIDNGYPTLYQNEPLVDQTLSSYDLQ